MPCEIILPERLPHQQSCVRHSCSNKFSFSNSNHTWEFLVLRALPKCQALQKSTRALLGSLPLSDLGIGLFAYPLLVTYCGDLFCAIQSRRPYAMVSYCLRSCSLFLDSDSDSGSAWFR